MNVTRVLKECYEVARRHPVMFVPLLAASVFAVLFSLIVVGSAVPMLGTMAADPNAVTPEQFAAGVGAAATGMFLVSVVGGIAYLLAHGMTVVMADLALKGRTPTLQAGWSGLTARLGPIILASILVGLLVGLGVLLLVVPGIILAFLLMFTLVSVIVDDTDAVDAIKRSVRAVTGHFRETFVVFLVLIALGVLSGVVSGILGIIPFLGAILTMAVSAIYTGYMTLFMLRAYREITSPPGPPPAG